MDEELKTQEVRWGPEQRLDSPVGAKSVLGRPWGVGWAGSMRPTQGPPSPSSSCPSLCPGLGSQREMQPTAGLTAFWPRLCPQLQQTQELREHKVPDLMGLSWEG